MEIAEDEKAIIVCKAENNDHKFYFPASLHIRYL